MRIPKLPQNKLLAAAFTHYDRQLKPGEPRAQQVAKQFTNAQDQREFLNDIAIAYLRHQITESNPEFSEVISESRSPEVRALGVNLVFDQIRNNYPGIHHQVEELRERELTKLETPAAEPTSNRQAAPEAARATAPLTKPQGPGSNADIELVKGQATQVVNAMLICLQTVHDHLVPEAAKFGVVLDSQAEHSFAMSAWIELARGSKAHWKMPSTRMGQG